MKRLINIQNNIHRVVCYLSITILMGGSIFFVFPPTDVNAETKQACQREIEGIIGKLGAKPSPEGYAKALRYCQAGDKRSAMRVLRADIGAGQRKQASMEACERELTEFSKRSGAQPSKIAYHKALRYCQAGDMREARNVLTADSRSKSKEQMSKKECKDKINRLSFKFRFPPSKEAYSKAVSQCQAGDMRSAHRVLKADNESGSKKKVSKAWCKEYLKVSSSRLGVTTSKKSFSKALGYCQQRDLEKAQKVLTAER